MLVFGVRAPIVWTHFVRKRSLAELGLTRKRLLLSITIQVVVAGIQPALAWGTFALPPIVELLPLLGSALYALYHIGYGMRWSEMLFLFGIGVMFAVIFRITRSVFVRWPLFQPFGQLMAFVRDRLSLPGAAVLGFVDVLALAITVAVGFSRRGKKEVFAP